MENSTTATSNQAVDQHQDKLRVRDLYKELGEAGLQAISQEFYDRVYGAFCSEHICATALLTSSTLMFQRMTRSRGSGTCLR
jgi:hypothetical protein